MFMSMIRDMRVWILLFAFVCLALAKSDECAFRLKLPGFRNIENFEVTTDITPGISCFIYDPKRMVQSDRFFLHASSVSEFKMSRDLQEVFEIGLPMNSDPVLFCNGHQFSPGLIEVTTDEIEMLEPLVMKVVKCDGAKKDFGDIKMEIFAEEYVEAEEQGLVNAKDFLPNRFNSTPLEGFCNEGDCETSTKQNLWDVIEIRPGDVVFPFVNITNVKKGVPNGTRCIYATIICDTPNGCELSGFAGGANYLGGNDTNWQSGSAVINNTLNVPIYAGIYCCDQNRTGFGVIRADNEFSVYKGVAQNPPKIIEQFVTLRCGEFSNGGIAAFVVGMVLIGFSYLGASVARY